jgi:hypothetical protein
MNSRSQANWKISHMPMKGKTLSRGIAGTSIRMAQKRARAELGMRRARWRRWPRVTMPLPIRTARSGRRQARNVVGRSVVASMPRVIIPARAHITHEAMRHDLRRSGYRRSDRVSRNSPAW